MTTRLIPLAVLLLAGCESSHDYSLKADTAELQAVAETALEYLAADGLQLQRPTTLRTVPAERSDGAFVRDIQGEPTWVMGYWDGRGGIEVSQPYQYEIVKHELRHACGDNSIEAAWRAAQ